MVLDGVIPMFGLQLVAFAYVRELLERLFPVYVSDAALLLVTDFPVKPLFLSSGSA